MEQWRKRYYRNYAFGIIISAVVHLTVLVFVYFLLKKGTGERQNYYYLNTYTVRLTDKFSNDSTGGGGGSLGSLTNDIGKGVSAPKILAGIPVPSPEPDSIEFGKVTNLEEPKDSLAGVGSGMGTGSGTGIGSGKGNGIGDGSDDGINFRSLPFIPKQILEVLPQNVDGERGEILLLLKIGKDGFVKEHKVIINTINDPIVLKNVLEAAYKSRWEKIIMQGSKIEYWIEKKYRYN